MANIPRHRWHMECFRIQPVAGLRAHSRGNCHSNPEDWRISCVISGRCLVRLRSETPNSFKYPGSPRSSLLYLYYSPSLPSLLRSSLVSSLLGEVSASSHSFSLFAESIPFAFHLASRVGPRPFRSNYLALLNLDSHLP